MKKLYLLLITLLLFNCVENSPIDIKQHSLKPPADAPTINKAALKTDHDYSVGYANGNIRSDRVTFSWQATNDPDFLSYKIYRSNSLIMTITSNDSSTLIDSTLFKNTTYDFKVVTLTKRGTSSFDTVRIKTPKFDSPSIQGHEMVTATSIKIYWLNRAESATSFIVERIHPDSAVFFEVATVADTFYVDSNDIQSGRQYKYRVSASNPYETTLPSFSYTVTVPSFTSHWSLRKQ